MSPADISSPLRSVLTKSKNTKVLLGEVNDINSTAQKVMVGNKIVPYDTLIVATGAKQSYFAKDNWATFGPGLKTVEDAIEMRRRIFIAFEAAEEETDAAEHQALLTFVIVGGGPTGVELAGVIAELATKTVKEDFGNIDTLEARVLLLEGLDRILPPLHQNYSKKHKHI